MSLLYLKMYLFKQESPKRFFPLTIIEITKGKDKLIRKAQAPWSAPISAEGLTSEVVL